MALRRFRIEVEGIDKEDVEQQLDYFFQRLAGSFLSDKKPGVYDFECTDENIKAIQKNGQPLMYGRRVFVVEEKTAA